jgi:hypothetical protein
MKCPESYHYIVGWDEELLTWVASVVEEPTLRATGLTAVHAKKKLLRDLQDVLGPLTPAQEVQSEEDQFVDCT